MISIKTKLRRATSRATNPTHKNQNDLLYFYFLPKKFANRKYKFGEKEGAYFLSFATVYWVAVFTSDLYFETIPNNNTILEIDLN